MLNGKLLNQQKLEKKIMLQSISHENCKYNFFVYKSIIITQNM